MDYERYKFVVNVTIGEIRGEGVKYHPFFNVRVGARCFWDADTDNVAQETYINVFRRLRRILYFALQQLTEFTTIKA
jgi:hypothetical protein